MSRQASTLLLPGTRKGLLVKSGWSAWFSLGIVLMLKKEIIYCVLFSGYPKLTNSAHSFFLLSPTLQWQEQNWFFAVQSSGDSPHGGGEVNELQCQSLSCWTELPPAKLHYLEGYLFIPTHLLPSVQFSCHHSAAVSFEIGQHSSCNRLMGFSQWELESTQ